MGDDVGLQFHTAIINKTMKTNQEKNQHIVNLQLQHFVEEYDMANFIKEIRTSQSLTLDQLAERVGTTPQQINLLEAGKRKLTWEWMQRLADGLECHPLDLVEGPAVPKDEGEKDLLRKFRGLEDGQKRMFSHMLDGLSKDDDKQQKDNADANTDRKRR